MSVKVGKRKGIHAPYMVVDDNAEWLSGRRSLKEEVKNDVWKENGYQGDEVSKKR